MRTRYSSLLVVALIALPAMAQAEKAQNLRQAVRQSGQNVVKAVRHTGKTLKWTAIGTAGVTGAAIAGAGAVGFLTGNHTAGEWFNPAAMNATVEFGQRFAETAIRTATSPEVLTLAATGAGAYIAYPTARYAGAKAIDKWRKGGLSSDFTVGLLAGGAGLALGNTDPMNFIANAYISQMGSFGARHAVNGAAKLLKDAGR